jgi:hypothetical protein
MGGRSRHAARIYQTAVCVSNGGFKTSDAETQRRGEEIAKVLKVYRWPQNPWENAEIMKSENLR